jgi:hypothetical protein
LSNRFFLSKGEELAPRAQSGPLFLTMLVKFDGARMMLKILLFLFANIHAFLFATTI